MSASATAILCQMCEKREMKEVSQNPEAGFFLMCPNCDSENGKMPPPKVEDQAE